MLPLRVLFWTTWFLFGSNPLPHAWSQFICVLSVTPNIIASLRLPWISIQVGRLSFSPLPFLNLQTFLSLLDGQEDFVVICWSSGTKASFICLMGGGWLRMAGCNLSFGKDLPDGMILKRFGHYLGCGTCSTFCMISLKWLTIVLLISAVYSMIFSEACVVCLVLLY